MKLLSLLGGALLVAVAPLLTAPGPAVPSTENATVPAFSVHLLDEHRTISDAELRGTYTLISFWSTTCPPCVTEIENIQRVYEAFGDRMEILSISRDRDPDTVREFRRTRHAMPWMHAVVGSDRTVFEAFGVRGTPHLVLVDPQGEIVATTRHLTGERLIRNVRAAVAGCGG
jgi:peroxiredoxin